MSIELIPSVILLTAILIGIAILIFGIIQYIKTPEKKRVISNTKIPSSVSIIAGILLILISSSQIYENANNFSVAAGVIWLVLGLSTLVQTLKSISK